MTILDFSKAFNKVPHQRLLNKLHHHRIKNILLEWLGDFSFGRIQRVVYGESSAGATLISGVPQGSLRTAPFPVVYK